MGYPVVKDHHERLEHHAFGGPLGKLDHLERKGPLEVLSHREQRLGSLENLVLDQFLLLW